MYFIMFFYFGVLELLVVVHFPNLILLLLLPNVLSLVLVCFKTLASCSFLEHVIFNSSSNSRKTESILSILSFICLFVFQVDDQLLAWVMFL